MNGLVIKNTGSWVIVRAENGKDIPCKVKGNFRLKGLRTTNPVAIGDRITLNVNSDGSAFITAIEPRKNYIIRRASNLSKESHILAANIDRAFLIATLAHPATSTTFIDRFLATAEAYRVPATLVINKTDLLNDSDSRELLDAVTYLYSSIGYPVLHTSTITGEGIEVLNAELKGKISLLAGHSGVGKSSIINTIIPQANTRTAEISDVHDTGMHTTTFSEAYELPESGWIIDTPGIKGFGTIEMNRDEVGHYFPEIFATAENCRYGNCTHTHEPGCAVLKALGNQRIAQSRYNSYLSILDDTNPDKYRKPF
ncbi:MULTISPECIES: ribosome small subunit-dependent GTPase A [Muribaculum]|jgi:ribosome biogenesis GTPase|uniref:Ribosome small subunit-dependent GTPase A n=2 Tax=Muribaculum TaxID=1918540 RepID=A0AC61S3W4_9BACT|nr:MULTISPECIES: ribosome small subunit-dependent GTPase A [Muribaculum]THG45849.1 ribosome small subunit-dependent GTPase A [Muribaculum caecicola]